MTRVTEEGEGPGQGSSAGAGTGAVTGAGAGTGAPQQAAKSKEPVSYESEKSKYVVRKAGSGGQSVWAVNIVFYGRSKFLGYFSSYETAVKTFDAAYHIRTVMLNNANSTIRFKGKIGRDMKLSGNCFNHKYRNII